MPRKKNKDVKVVITGYVDGAVYKKFIANSVKFAGPRHGHKGMSLEQAMQLFNNYFQIYEDTNLIEIANEHDNEPWEFGQTIIRRFCKLHLDKNISLHKVTDEDHDRYIQKYIKKD